MFVRFATYLAHLAVGREQIDGPADRRPGGGSGAAGRRRNIGTKKQPSAKRGLPVFWRNSGLPLWRRYRTERRRQTANSGAASAASSSGRMGWAQRSPVAAGRLFDRFYTVEAARNSTGLGLSIAKVLTERMGGTLEAAYEAGRLTLTADFPKKSQDTSQ